MRNFIPFTIVVLLFSGCVSWQQALTFGLIKSESEKLQERLDNECEEKNAISCNNLAVNFSSDKEFEKAKIYYEKACELNLATACSNLGQIYEKGLVDGEQNLQKALKLYSISCDNGDGVGCYNKALAIYSSSSEEQKVQNGKITIKLLEKSCKFEYKQACVLLQNLKNH